MPHRDRTAFDCRYADKFRNPVPDGECYADAYARALDWARERDPARGHVVIGHGAFNRMLLAALTGLDPETLLDQADPQDAVMVIEARAVASRMRQHSKITQPLPRR